MSFVLFILFAQLCYTAFAEVASFLYDSYGRPQVQTVPSSAWDAPCPVVTPSRDGLGSAFSAHLLNGIAYDVLKPLINSKSPNCYLFEHTDIPNGKRERYENGNLQSSIRIIRKNIMGITLCFG